MVAEVPPAANKELGPREFHGVIHGPLHLLADPMQLQARIPPAGKPLHSAPEVEVGRRILSAGVQQIDRGAQVETATHPVAEQESQAAQAWIARPTGDTRIRRALLPSQGGHFRHPAVSPSPHADTLHAGEGYARQVDLASVEGGELPSVHGNRKKPRTQSPLYRVMRSAEPGSAKRREPGHQIGKKILEGHRVRAQYRVAVPLIRRPRPPLRGWPHFLGDLLKGLLLCRVGESSGKLALQFADQRVGGSLRNRPIRLLRTKPRS